MQTEWILTIDLRQHPKGLRLEFNLLDRDRRHRWKDGCEVFAETFHDMVRDIATFFDYNVPPLERQERIKKFRWLANRTFDLDKFLKRTKFSPADTLTINTLVTAIPWDLVPYEDNYLGHLVSVGLKIPTPSPAHQYSVAGEGRPRFLHIVANPANDLLHAAEEVRELQTLLTEIRGVDYELMTNPTPSELINNFSTGRSTPFLHFTGHVLPKKGLLLKEGIFSIEHITRYFPWQRDQFVLLNGCDAVYEGDAGLESEVPDLFQSASVANAFLDAGAEAVIAPRSRIADEEARHAATQIWKMIFAADELGGIIRKFRSETVQAKPSAISGYSYVLYGEPSSRLRISSYAPTLIVGKAAEKEAEAPAILEHEILREAWGDAGGPVAPRHIFAALTRRWIVGQIFFGVEKQRYFLALERLRRELGVNSPPPPPTIRIEFTPAGSLVVDRAQARHPEAALNDLALLEGLAQVDDAEVRCALEALERGPRSIETVLLYAREWAKDGRTIPEAIVEPDGFFNPRIFPPNFLAAEPGATVETPVDRWDLFVALVTTGANVAGLWAKQVGAPPPPAGWSSGQALHWRNLTDSLQRAIADLIEIMKLENAQQVTEGRLLMCLVDKQHFQWQRLPPHARDWLATQGFNAERWEKLLARMRQAGLAWV